MRNSAKSAPTTSRTSNGYPTDFVAGSIIGANKVVVVQGHAGGKSTIVKETDSLARPDYPSPLNAKFNGIVEAVSAHRHGTMYPSAEVALVMESMADPGWMVNQHFFRTQDQVRDRLQELRAALFDTSVADYAALFSPTFCSQIEKDYVSKIVQVRKFFRESPRASPEEFQAILRESLAYQLMPIIPPPPRVARVLDEKGQCQLDDNGKEKEDIFFTPLRFDFSGKGAEVEGVQRSGFRQLKIKWDGESVFEYQHKLVKKRVTYEVRVHTKTSDSLKGGLTTSVVTMSYGPASWVLQLAPSNCFIQEYGVERSAVIRLIRDHGLPYVRRAGRDGNAVWVPEELKKQCYWLDSAVAAKLLAPLHFTVPLELLSPDLLSERGNTVLGLGNSISVSKES